MSYATGHNSFTSHYLLNIYLLQTLQIMYNKCVEKKMPRVLGMHRRKVYLQIKIQEDIKKYKQIHE
jgi:hypothetical protein